MNKIKVEIEMEFDLERFKEWFTQIPKKKGWTWKNELMDLIDSAIEGLGEDLFGYCGIDKFEWEIKKLEVVKE